MLRTSSIMRRGLIVTAFVAGSAFVSFMTTGQPLPGSSVTEAHGSSSYHPPTPACTWFFRTAAVGTEFNQGDTWQGATFTSIENGNHMLVRQETDSSIVGRFPMGYLNGDNATITFASPIHITTIIWHDNDPNPGEAGWSFNGIVGPLTGEQTTIQTSVNLTVSTVKIDAGGDSGGVDFCFEKTKTQTHSKPKCSYFNWKDHPSWWEDQKSYSSHSSKSYSSKSYSSKSYSSKSYGGSYGSHH